MSLYVLSPFVSDVVASTGGSGATTSAQSFTLYSNTSSVIVTNLSTVSTQYIYYYIAYDYAVVPATLTDQNSGVIAASSTLSISLGTATQRPGSGTDGALKLFFATDVGTQQVRLTQVLVNRT